jgi:DNA-binding response OmpR family regulator
MDIQLPIMDGYTATRLIKTDPALRSIPIIAVTSYALAVEEKKARAAGCDDYVTKPFSPRQLLAKIRQYIPQSSSFARFSRRSWTSFGIHLVVISDQRPTSCRHYRASGAALTTSRKNSQDE